MNEQDKETSLIDIIKNLQERIGKLESEIQILRHDVRRPPTDDEMEQIYQAVMKRIVRDLNLKTQRR